MFCKIKRDIKKKRRKKSPLEIAKVKAWKALSKWKRNKGVCQKCGKYGIPAQFDAHHIIPKSLGNYARFNEENIICLCKYCHMYWWHGSATIEERRDLAISILGKETYDQIHLDAKKTVDYTLEDYENMIIEFEDKMCGHQNNT